VRKVRIHKKGWGMSKDKEQITKDAHEWLARRELSRKERDAKLKEVLLQIEAFGRTSELPKPKAKSALRKHLKPVEITPDLTPGLMGYPFGGTSFKIKK